MIISANSAASIATSFVDLFITRRIEEDILLSRISLGIANYAMQGGRNLFMEEARDWAQSTRDTVIAKLTEAGYKVNYDEDKILRINW